MQKMSFDRKKAAQEKSKPPKVPALSIEPYDDATIDLTEAGTGKQVENTDSSESLSIDRPLSKPLATEGGITVKKKRKSGGAELLSGLKKRQTSGKMIDKQMCFANKLAEFEEVLDEIEVEKGEIGALFVNRIPRPAEWVNNPGRLPSCEQNAASLEIRALLENEKFAKITKTAECMKHMNIEAHPQTLKPWYMETLPAEAAALGVKVIEEPALCYRAIGMSRTMPRELVAGQDQMLELSDERKSSMRFLYILAASDAAQLLQGGRLSAHVAARRHALRGQLTLLVLDCHQHFRKGKPEADLEEAIIDLIVTLEVDTVLVKNSDELISVILQFAKAVAEEPAKLAKHTVDEEAGFYMRGDNKNCVTVDQKGNGLPRLWQQMLSVLPQSSLEVSRAIAAAYPSPRALSQALRSEGGEEKLAALGVARSAAPGARPRLLGKEMSRRLNILFTEYDGNLLVE